MIIIIGRGHSGTRSISHTLSESGVFMGTPLNVSGDLLPPEALYDACRVFARYIDWDGEMSWNWDKALKMELPGEFTQLVEEYLTTVLEHPSPLKGYKLPETTLIFPWIVRLFPNAHYIYWVRNPRDSIIGRHLTDDLMDFDIPYKKTDDERLSRAISWKYQYDIVKATPLPEKWMRIRFEDFIQNQQATLEKLESYLGIPLATIPVRPDSVGRWKKDEGTNYFPFFEPAMLEFGYEIPASIEANN